MFYSALAGCIIGVMMRLIEAESTKGKHGWATIAACLVVSVGWASGCTATIVPEAPTSLPTFLTHVDEDNGFSISYPKDWEKECEDCLSETEIVAFSALAGEHEGQAFFSVAKENWPSETTALSYFEEAKAALEASEGRNYDFVSKEQLVIDGAPAIKHILAVDSAGERSKAIQVYLAQGKSIWIMTFICAPEFFDLWEPTFDAIASSFRLLPPKL